MNFSDRRWTEEQIKEWANTSSVAKTGGFLVAQHYKDKLFHYFAPVGKYWEYKMNSVTLHSMEPNG